MNSFFYYECMRTEMKAEEIWEAGGRLWSKLRVEYFVLCAELTSQLYHEHVAMRTLLAAPDPRSGVVAASSCASA